MKLCTGLKQLLKQYLGNIPKYGWMEISVKIELKKSDQPCDYHAVSFIESLMNDDFPVEKTENGLQGIIFIKDLQTIAIIEEVSSIQLESDS